MKDKFYDYLLSLELFRWRITETPTAFEAVVTSEPPLAKFSQVLKNDDGTWWVRLSKADLFNDGITGGFFGDC